MNLRFLFLLTLTVCQLSVSATRIHGIVRDDKGNPLPYSSILVKGTTRGVTANNEGKYFIDLDPGNYTLVCQYVGYTREEKALKVGQEGIELNFALSPQQLSMAEVVVRPGGEDPAYAIIRQAIKKRKDYEHQLDSFTCEAYIKSLVKTRGLPKRILGQKIEDKDKKEMGVDSAGRGILFLSESLTKVAFKRPNKIKLEVISGRESGGNGYGFSFPTFIDFYGNNVAVMTKTLNPRGFVSPIAESALNFYRYKYLGSFFEDGKEINQIQVIPRRKFEPLFSGTINIVDGEWRIHSLDLLLVKESQLEMLDTLRIRQIHAPVPDQRNVWQVKDQVVYFTFNIFGIDAVGNFLNVYNNYDVAPRFRKRFFNNVLMKYDTAANKKTRAYWDSIRPLPLEPEEITNYTVRDSIYHQSQDSLWSTKNRDSLLRKQGHVTVKQLFISGFSRSDFRVPHATVYSWDPLWRGLEYNTVEGLNLTAGGTISSTTRNGVVVAFSPHVRYGFHNTRLNAWGALSFYKKSSSWDEEGGSASRQTWTLSGGRRISQFNPGNPIKEEINSIYTLLFHRNYMKIYQNDFAKISWLDRMDNGLRIQADAWYENRIPLDNSTGYSLIKYKDRVFTPNYPFEQLNDQFVPHQAVITSVGLQYQPGQRYIEFPNRKVAIGSKYPTLALNYQKGWQGVLGSDVNFDKWQFSIWDGLDLKLKGQLSYRFSMGGFINAHSVFIQDYQHFNGNQTVLASQYVNSFQLAPYYANSTTANFYATGHLEHHFNGLLTNKIPLFRRLNWHLVGGANAFYVNANNHYEEVFGGLENIFKVLRVDMVGSWLNGRYSQTGVRIGFGGLLGGAIH